MKRQPKRIRTVLVQFYVFYILLALVLVVSVSSWLFGVILNETIRNQARQDMDIAKGIHWYKKILQWDPSWIPLQS